MSTSINKSGVVINLHPPPYDREDSKAKEKIQKWLSG